MYLIDTNVISETSKPAPHPNVLAWLARLERPTLSVIALSELEYGIGRIGDAPRRTPLRQWMEEVKRNSELIPVTEQIALLAGRLRAESSRRGRQLTLADALIAATAIASDRKLATRNVHDFDSCGVEVVNPFDAALSR
jgi:predicted nucleic acid-binding protein